MKKLLITLLFTAFAVSAYSQLPAGSISNKRGFFFELKGRDTLGAYTGIIKVDTLQLVSGQKLYRLTDTAAIYTLLNSKIDSVSKSNDTLFFHRDNTTPLAIAITGLSDTPTLTMVLTKNASAPTKNMQVDTGRMSILRLDSSRITDKENVVIFRYDTTSDVSSVSNGYKSMFIGEGAGQSFFGNGKRGYAVVGIGHQCLQSLSTTVNSQASSTTAMGHQALSSVTTGSFNHAFGTLALSGCVTCERNSAFGYHSGFNARGTGGVFVGDRAGAGDSSQGSVAVGQLALNSANTGINIAIGPNALRDNTSGSVNVAVGNSAMLVNTSGGNNTAIGSFALDLNTTGSNNTAVGRDALGSNTTQVNQTAVGYRALFASTGQGNIGLGVNAGSNITSGQTNIVIGAGIGTASATASNQLNIGDIIYGQDIYGASGKIGIGYLNDTLSYTLQVQGTAKISNTPTGLSGDSLVVKDDTTGQLKAIAFAQSTYTPTLTQVANLDSAIVYTLSYTRMGNSVTVTGKVDIATSLGSQVTQLGISLPVASNFTTITDCSGTATSYAPGGSAEAAIIMPDITNDRAMLQYVESSASSHQFHFTFTYTVK